MMPAPRPQLVRVRTEGLQIMSPLQADVAQVRITDGDTYIEADALLSRIRTARAKWATKVDPIRVPLKAALDAAKEAMQGVKDLDAEVDGPLGLMEQKVRTDMKSYKLIEAENIRSQKQEQERQAQRLRDEAAQKAAAAAAAKSPQMRARLEQRRAELEEAAEEAVEPTVDTTPIQAGSSGTRTVQKVRISNPALFLKSLTDYAPKAGIYQVGRPPLSILTLKVGRDGMMKQEGSALDVMETEVSKIYSTQPGVVVSWPGVEQYDDIVIAARR